MKVERIVNESVNSGVKNNKQWSQASVQLNDGQIVRIFNPVMVGDEVESEQNGQYTNWKVKQSSASVGSDVEKIINQMAKDIQTLMGRVGALETERTIQEKIASKVVSQVDEVSDMPEWFGKKEEN